MSKTLLHAETVHDITQVLAADVYRHGIVHLVAEFEAVVIHVGDHHVTRANMTADTRRHDPDGTGAGDEHVLADQIEGERGVNRIAEWVEDGADLVIDLGRQVDRVEGGQLEILGEGARDIDADALRLGIEMEMAGARHAALHADEVALARDAVTHLHGAHVAAHLDDGAGEFVSHHHGTGIVFLAHSSHFQMWRSVPQMPVFATLIRMSSGPICGAGSSRRTRPSSGLAFTSALMKSPSMCGPRS